MNKSLTAHPAYRADIDGLRAIAVLAVVFFHAFPKVVAGGFIGVDIFFVISGFLISTIIMREHAAERFSYQNFYIRRIRRIFPALIVVLSFCFVVGWFSLFPDEFRLLGKQMAAGSLFVSNFALWNESGYFDVVAERKPLLHLWSLGIEEQFYIFWPMILGLAWVRRFTLALLLSILSASFLLGVVLVAIDPTAAFYFPLSRFWELLIGAVLAWVALNRPEVMQRYGNIRALAGAGLLVAGFLFISQANAFPGWWALLPSLGAMLLISAGEGAWVNRVLLSNRLLVAVGLISYPLYLWHWPLMAFMRILKNEELSTKSSINAIVISLLLAWLTYRFVEIPVRKNTAIKKQAVVLSIVMLIPLLAGAAAYIGNGFNQREAAKVASQESLDEIKWFKETVASDGSCLRLASIPEHETANLVCLAMTANPEYMVIGDSHAMAFTSSAVLGRTSFNGVLMGQHGCLPFTEYTTRTPAETSSTKQCREAARTALDFVKRTPSIKSVLLLTRGPFYFSGSGFGVEGPVNMGIYNSAEQITDSRRAFVEGYSQTVHELLKAGKQVVFFIDWPELGIDPAGCVGARFLKLSKAAPKSDCTNPLNAVEHRQAEYRALVKEVASRNPGMKIYDPLPIFCEGVTCYGKRKGHVYYFDDDHVGIAGSALLIEDFKAWAARR